MKLPIARFLIPAVAWLVGAVHGGELEALQHKQQIGYHVTNLSSLGGTSSGANSINDRGLVAGFSNLPGDATAHATLG